jgi:hypothetical protein
MRRITIVRVLGEGSLIFQAMAVLPIWSELSLDTDNSYPLVRNLLVIVGFVSVPSIICLVLSHPLYRQPRTMAPVACCALSLAMLMASSWLWYVATTSGEKGIILIPLIVVESLAGVVAFAFLRYRFRKIHSPPGT